MTIRDLQEKDISEVEAIFDLYWSGFFRNNLSSKLRKYIEKDSDLESQKFKFVVVEDDGEVVGVAAFRKVQTNMVEYTTTSNPVEFYVSAVKYKGKGIGTFLRKERIEEAKKLGYTEAVFFSAEDHKDSWNFHDSADFKRIADSVAPDGERGKVWGMML